MFIETILCAFVLVLASVLLCVMAPGLMSLLFVLLMVAITAVAFVFGIARVSSYDRAFIRASREVKRATTVQAQEVWQVIRAGGDLFKNEKLDRTFDRYRADVDQARAESTGILPDIEDYVNIETVGLSTWRGVVLQVPSVLTGIGILGTFVGLIIGVGGVSFSSVTAAINGVESLLAGIQIAFYTSIAGLSLSILFNLAYRIMWNIMARNLRRFTLDFQDAVIPSTDAQDLLSQQEYRRQVVSLLSAEE